MTSRPVTTVERQYDRGVLWAAILVAGGWHVVSAVPAVLTIWLRHGPAAAEVGVWLAYATVGVAAAVVQLRGGGRGAALPAVVVPVLLIGMVVAALANHRTGSLFDANGWAFGDAGWFALVALWRHRLPELLAFFLANAAVGGVLLAELDQTDRINLARFIMVAYGVSVVQIAIFAGGHALTALARETAAAQDAQARITTGRLAAEAVHRARRNRYEVVQRTATTILSGLATDAVDLTAPRTRQQLQVAVSRLRRLIVETDDVPNPLLHELRACVDAAERRQIAVDLQAPVGILPAIPLEVRRALTEPVIQVLATTHASARVTVVVTDADVAVAVLADAVLDEFKSGSNDTIQLSYHREGDKLWVQAQWNRPSP